MRDAYRLPQAPPECVAIGSALSENSDHPLDAIAAAAAEHGGTHYVVHKDKTEITGYRGTGGTAMGITVVTLNPVKSRTVWARVYRCPAEHRSPNG